MVYPCVPGYAKAGEGFLRRQGMIPQLNLNETNFSECIIILRAFISMFSCYFIYYLQRFGIGMFGDVAPRATFIVSIIIGCMYLLGRIICYIVVRQCRKKIKRGE